MLTLLNSPGGGRARPLAPGSRRAGIGLLLALLLGATLCNEAIYRLLGQFWQNVFAGAGLAAHMPPLLRPGGALGQVTHTPRDIPAVVSYSVLYVGLCGGLLGLLLPQAAQRRLVLVFYGLAGAAAFLLLLGGKLGSEVATTLASQLLHFVVSPVPVGMLAPLLRWYYPNKAAAPPALHAAKAV